MSRYLADCCSKFYEYARVPLGGRNQEVGKGYSPLIQSSNNDNLLFASVAAKPKKENADPSAAPQPPGGIQD
ncbi:hypothetical protein AFLA_005225 [Aspergillus flavus NRRL3357]|nr:hypothetical protein AFLA_005225 [Aspergillus flavus NRRL3357]